MYGTIFLFYQVKLYFISTLKFVGVSAVSISDLSFSYCYGWIIMISYVVICVHGYAARQFAKEGVQPRELAIISKESILSIQHLHKICTLYWNDNYNTRSVSQDVIVSMRELMTENSNDPESNSFLLDGDSTDFSKGCMVRISSIQGDGGRLFTKCLKRNEVLQLLGFCLLHYWSFLMSTKMIPMLSW